jgi:NADH dehydrogenase
MNSSQNFDIVTGAFGYSGKYITHRLLAQGRQVITLTGNPQRQSPFGQAVPAFPFHFDNPAALRERLRGADTLYNTYWVRFDYGDRTYQQAVENTRRLFAAAQAAGVRRIVHISITNPSLDSPLPYFRGKAQLEQELQGLGVSYAILRPTVIFGKEDILINNIAYLLRRFPIFAVPGDGSYRLQPIYVEDLAELAVTAGASQASQVIDAVGPEIYTFERLVREIAAAVGRRPILAYAPPWLALAAARALSVFLRDVLLTREEVLGLMANLLVSAQPPTATTRLSDWVKSNAHLLGARYASELQRHYQPAAS